VSLEELGMAQRGGHERRVRHVAFPAVNRNGSGRLIRLECVAYLDRHDHPQTPDRRFDEVIRRERGRNGDVNPPFTFFDTNPRIGNGYDLTGESFQLAVVIADRMVRHGYSERRPVIATGRLPDSDGTIGAVDETDFDGKLNVLFELASTDCVFCFPRINGTGPASAKLTRLAMERRVTLRPVDRLEELEDLWTRPAVSVWLKMARWVGLLIRHVAGWLGSLHRAALVATLTATMILLVIALLSHDDVGDSSEAGSTSINTSGRYGAYQTLFCDPLVRALKSAYLPGYRCTLSAGTMENILRVLKWPTSVSLGQLDMLALEALKRPELLKSITVIRQDFACEGLWMVTRDPELTFRQISVWARRIPFVLPPQGSGPAASFAFLQLNDPEGLGRGSDANKRYVADATAVINEVASSPDNAVGFFVQFADPENANFRLIASQGLSLIPVASDEIQQIKLNGEAVYRTQVFGLRSGDVKTSCTPVAIITGAPEVFSNDPNKADDQKDLIDRIRKLPAERLLPQPTSFARVVSSAGRYVNDAMRELMDLIRNGT
jgi:hypothetical protein